MRIVAMPMAAMLTAGLCPAQPLDPKDQGAFLEQLRRNALAYTDNLPNFICTQITKRFVDYTGIGEKWKSLDTIHQKLTYFDRREEYRVLRVDGDNGGGAAFLKSIGPGITSSGEFGSTLRQIFDPSTGTAFTWDKTDELRGAQVHIFRFRVDREHSRAALSPPGSTILVGYHGLIYADQADQTVERITTEAECPEDSPLQGVAHVLDYGKVRIGSDTFVVPIHAELHLRMPDQRLRTSRKDLRARTNAIRNEVDFWDYRKYATKSEIRFDSNDRERKKE